MTLTLRADKGDKLTHEEIDGNFVSLLTGRQSLSLDLVADYGAQAGSENDIYAAWISAHEDIGDAGGTLHIPAGNY
jgi:hypothetical protein